MSEQPWSVLHVLANHEKRVAQHLGVRSIEHYLPLYRERSRWTDRVVTVERPLFVGYVFARFDQEARRSAISVPGVLRFLGDEHWNTIAPEEIARIRDGLANGYVLRPHPGIAVGKHVRVIHGLFAGAEGTVTEFHHQCKVVLSLSATNQCFSLELDIADIEPLHNVDPRSQSVLNRCIGWAGL